MTCHQALESLLHVELSDLATDGASSLADHLRGCARCRRVAGQVLTDTRLLAMAIPVASHRPQPARSIHWTLAPVAFAATLLVMLTLPARVTDEATVTRMAPVTVAGREAQQPPDAAAAPRAVARPIARRVVKAFPRAVPVVPARMEASNTAVSEAPLTVARAVTVTPPPGTRAAVLHTSDPKLVVVWLY